MSETITHLKPRQVAERLQMDYDTVLRAIHLGQLPAMNVARPDAKRADFRVSLGQLAEFERRCAVVPQHLADDAAQDVAELVERARAHSNRFYRDAA